VIVEAGGPALYDTRIADPVLTPLYEALSIHPFKRGNLSLPTFLSGSGKHENFSVKIENPVEVVRSLGIASKYPDDVEKDNEGPIVVTAELDQRQIDPEDWDALVNSTGFAVKARWVSDTIIASGYPYKLFIEMANAQYFAGEADELMNRRRHGGKFQIKSTSASAGSTTVTLIDATTSYD
jgi:hypothetical protein